MNYEAVRADEIVARFQVLRSELARLKLRQFSLKLRLARIYILQFLFSLIDLIAKVCFYVFNHIKKFVCHGTAPDRQIRTADLRRVK